VGVSKKGKKKGQKLSCVKLAICPDHPRRRRPLKFCVRGRVREVVIYFKFHENRNRGLGAVGGRKSPSPIEKAYGLYNSLYYRTSRDASHTAPPIHKCLHNQDPDHLSELCTPFFQVAERQHLRRAKNTAGHVGPSCVRHGWSDSLECTRQQSACVIQNSTLRASVAYLRRICFNCTQCTERIRGTVR